MAFLQHGLRQRGLRMIKKVKVEDLKPGMFIERVDNPWLNSPLIMTNFTVRSDKDLGRLQSYDIRHVFIDTSKGLDTTDYLARRIESPGLRVEDTFIASLDDFWPDRQMPVDIYNIEDNRLELIMRSGLTFGAETDQLLRDSGVKDVRVPIRQKLKFDQYVRTITHVREKQKEVGFAGSYLDPVKVAEYHKFKDNYRQMNPSLMLEGTITTFDIYAMINGAPSLVYKKGDKLTHNAVGKWKEEKLNLFIHSEEKDSYQEYIHKASERNKKDDLYQADFVRENSIIIVENLANNPRSEKLMKETKKTVSDLTSVVVNNPSTFYELIKINNYDYYTYTHSVNVSIMSIALALEAGINGKRELEDLGIGTMLHDLGKSKISRTIINKPGKLTDVEFDAMKKHVLLGRDLLEGNPLLTDAAMIPLMQHHEKLTGSGYPAGLNQGQIHTFGRIAGLIDIYDALTTERPYKKALMPFDALVIISKALEDYDKILFRLLVRLMQRQEV